MHLIKKYSRLRCLLHVKGFVICFPFGLVWSGSILQFIQNIIKVGSKSLLNLQLWAYLHTLHRDAFCQFPFRWIYYYGSNKRKGTWQNASLCTGSVVKGELHFWNGYLSLLYFLVVGMHLCLLSQFSNLIKFYKMTSRGDIFAQSRHAFILYFRENQLPFAKPIMYIQKSHYNKFENEIVCLILHQIYCTSLEIVHCVRN